MHFTALKQINILLQRILKGPTDNFKQSPWITRDRLPHDAKAVILLAHKSLPILDR